ncbi:putative head-tail adaptor protein [Pectobacterium phage PP101]|uniref:Putative head-tail adaptor protein n=1 Tax=Pectobacterium phage PP101 TaxID=1916414 RepID=A0A1J0MF30_9CAUD|nr:head protein [Pectobacterium phage PP101]APD19718.1 putative head-tail adaptor protein [Pectobacterium phage PP101]
MINQRLAFNRYTTGVHLIERYISGYYDSKNNWVGDTYAPPVKFRCTPIGYGDRDSGTNGQQLKATEIGERQPAFMQIHSRSEMPMKSIITVYGLRYKVTQISDYTDAGFFRVIVSKELEK